MAKAKNNRTRAIFEGIQAAHRSPGGNPLNYGEIARQLDEADFERSLERDDQNTSDLNHALSQAADPS